MRKIVKDVKDLPISASYKDPAYLPLIPRYTGTSCLCLFFFCLTFSALTLLLSN